MMKLWFIIIMKLITVFMRLVAPVKNFQHDVGWREFCKISSHCFPGLFTGFITIHQELNNLSPPLTRLFIIYNNSCRSFHLKMMLDFEINES